MLQRKNYAFVQSGTACFTNTAAVLAGYRHSRAACDNLIFHVMVQMLKGVLIYEDRNC